MTVLPTISKKLRQPNYHIIKENNIKKKIVIPLLKTKSRKVHNIREYCLTMRKKPCRINSPGKKMQNRQ